MFINPAIIAGWFSTFFCIILLKRFHREAQGSAATVQGARYVLHYSKELRICVVAYALLVAAIFGYCFLVVSWHGPAVISPITLFISIGFVIALLLTPVLIHIFRTRIEYDANFLYTFTPWREKRTILWEGIVRYSFNRVLGQHVFGLKGGDTLRFGVLLLGQASLLHEARMHGIPGLGER